MSEQLMGRCPDALKKFPPELYHYLLYVVVVVLINAGVSSLE